MPYPMHVTGDEEFLDELSKRQPGCDGGKLRSRYTVSDELASRAASYRQSGMHDLADALPTRYKAMLSTRRL
jgi:hypothetical protein